MCDLLCYLHRELWHVCHADQVAFCSSTLTTEAMFERDLNAPFLPQFFGAVGHLIIIAHVYWLHEWRAPDYTSCCEFAYYALNKVTMSRLPTGLQTRGINSYFIYGLIFNNSETKWVSCNINWDNQHYCTKNRSSSQLIVRLVHYWFGITNAECCLFQVWWQFVCWQLLISGVKGAALP